MKTPGFEGKLRIGGATMSFQRVSIRINGQEVRVDNSEGEAGNPGFSGGEVGGEARIPDTKGGEMTVSQATFDDAKSPWAAPISLAVNDYVGPVNYYPTGLTGPFYYNWLNCLVRSSSLEAAIPGGQPVSFTIVTDGLYEGLEMKTNPGAV